MKPVTDILAGPSIAAPSRLRDFYELTKPRMNLLVVLTTAIGFFLARVGTTDWMLLLNTVLGTGLCAAYAAVFNQLIERECDARMQRTRNRPIPAGRVTTSEAAVVAVACGFAGLTCLAILVNLLTALLGFVTIITYLAIYTPSKRITTLNTV